jgi:G6PDH family F420-dependent oxidoreductase
VVDARLWDLPDEPVPLDIAVSGEQSCARVGRIADLVIATEPKRELLDAFGRHGGAGRPRIGQLPVRRDTDGEAAVARAHDRFRRALGGRRVNAGLPGPPSFARTSSHARATEAVLRQDIAHVIPCGEDVDMLVEAVRPFVQAGFTGIALVRTGGAHQLPFLDRAEKTLLPVLRRSPGGTACHGPRLGGWAQVDCDRAALRAGHRVAARPGGAPAPVRRWAP